MALVKNLKGVEYKNIRENITETECTYFILEKDDKKYFQIDSYGSSERKNYGRTSQSLRFTEDVAKQLKDILEKHF